MVPIVTSMDDSKFKLVRKNSRQSLVWMELQDPMLRLFIAIATPCFGSETQTLAMPVGAHLQSMFTLVPLRACCLISCLSVVPFLIFFMSTIVKSAPPSSTASADCLCNCQLPTTLANEGLWGEAAEEGWMVNRPPPLLYVKAV